MTNYERIKTMSKEELVNLLGDFAKEGYCACDRKVCDYCKSKHGGNCAGQTNDCCFPYGGNKLISVWLDQESIL